MRDGAHRQLRSLTDEGQERFFTWLLERSAFVFLRASGLATTENEDVVAQMSAMRRALWDFVRQQIRRRPSSTLFSLAHQVLPTSNQQGLAEALNLDFSSPSYQRPVQRGAERDRRLPRMFLAEGRGPWDVGGPPSAQVAGGEEAFPVFHRGAQPVAEREVIDVDAEEPEEDDHNRENGVGELDADLFPPIVAPTWLVFDRDRDENPSAAAAGDLPQRDLEEEDGAERGESPIAETVLLEGGSSDSTAISSSSSDDLELPLGLHSRHLFPADVVNLPPADFRAFFWSLTRAGRYRLVAAFRSGQLAVPRVPENVLFLLQFEEMARGSAGLEQQAGAGSFQQATREGEAKAKAANFNTGDTNSYVAAGPYHPGYHFLQEFTDAQGNFGYYVPDITWQGHRPGFHFHDTNPPQYAKFGWYVKDGEYA